MYIKYLLLYILYIFCIGIISTNLMDNMMRNRGIRNILETSIMEPKRKLIAWSFFCYKYIEYHVFVLMMSYLPFWVYEVAYNTTLYQQLANMTACLDGIKYNVNALSNQLHSDLKLHDPLCFTKSELVVESSERKMFLMLPFYYTLQLSLHGVLWKFINSHIKERLFQGVLLISYLLADNENDRRVDDRLQEPVPFHDQTEDESFTQEQSVQATSQTVVDEFNLLCISTTPNHCLHLSRGTTFSIPRYSYV